MSHDWMEGWHGDLGDWERMAREKPELFDEAIKDSMLAYYAETPDKFACEAMGLMCSMARELSRTRVTLGKMALSWHKDMEGTRKQIEEANRMNAESAAQWECWRNEVKKEMEHLYGELHDSSLALSEFKLGTKALSGYWRCVTDLQARISEELRRVGRILGCAAESIREHGI